MSISVGKLQVSSQCSYAPTGLISKVFHVEESRRARWHLLIAK